jgi:hypothetical protein
MAVKCFSTIRGVAMRLTREDNCGKWQTGATASAISDGFVKIDLTAAVDAGATYQVKNAAGVYVVNEKGRPSLTNYGVKVQFARVDPAVFEMATGQSVILNYNGDAVGFAIDDIAKDVNFGLEAWTDVAGVDECAGGTNSWDYWLLPWVVNGILGDFSIQDGLINFDIMANTKGNLNWHKGPYNVVSSAAVLTPSPLLANVGSRVHVYNQLAEVAPPTATCGYVAQSVVWS